MTHSTTDTARREALGSFLRAKRQQLSPEDVGLSTGGRRRTPGLRREEVAVLANVGVSWYSRLEQGRDITPSSAVLAAIADALCLNVFEREYLTQLSTRQDLAATEIDCGRYRNIEQILQNIDGLPSVCLDGQMNVFACNPLANQLFGCTPGQNALESFFSAQRDPKKYRDQDNTAAMLVSQFRRNAARRPGDPTFAALAEKLSERSPLFDQLWSDHTVSTELVFQIRYTDDTHGTVNFDSTTLSVVGEDDLQVIVYLPQGDAAIDGSWAAIRTSLANEPVLRLVG